MLTTLHASGQYRPAADCSVSAVTTEHALPARTVGSDVANAGSSRVRETCTHAASGRHASVCNIILHLSQAYVAPPSDRN
jgi:hypothetical protein